MQSDTKNLKTLGSKETKYSDKPSLDILETFKNQHEKLYLIPFKCNEFTSLCPKTGQPDFAKLEIIYVPSKLCVESKSLKLYLFSFRNSGEFHEDVTNRITNDLKEKLNPLYIRVIGDFNVRGGISIKPLVIRYDQTLKDDSVNLSGIRELVENWDRIKHNLDD
jgi:7-cyano-7-deazaguanine reductase